MSRLVDRFTELPGVRALLLLVCLPPALAVAGRAAVSFESASSATTNLGTSLTINKPTLTATGDLMLAAVVVDDIGGGFSGTSYTAPSGWTQLNLGTCPNEPPRRCTMATWWKIAQPGEPGSYTFGWTGGSEPASGAIFRYSGTDASYPIGAVTAASGVHKANSPNRPKAPAITTTANDSVVVRILGNDREGGTWNAGTGHTTRHNVCNPSSDPNLVCLTMGDIGQATPGTLSTMNWEPAPSLTLIFWRSLSIEILPPQPRGDIEIFKDTLPDGGTDLFDFSTSGLVPTSFDLMDGESQLFAGVTSGSGLYSVSESVPAGWTRISYCDLGFPGNVEVVTGMTTECHFVNVDENQVPRCDLVGKADNAGGGGLYFSYSAGLFFDALAPFVLRAVHVYPGSSGTVVVNLKKGGILQASRTVAVSPTTGGARTRIEVDLPVPAGSGYELDAVGTTAGGLFRNNSGPTYPYDGDFVSITSSTAGSSFYYFFYDWEVERMDAVGASSKEFGGGTYTNLQWRLEFDASEPTRIHSVHVYPQSAGNVAIELRDSSNMLLDSVIQSVAAAPAGVKTPIKLDFLVPTGTGFSLGLDLANTTALLWRNFSGGAYPFSTSSLSISGNSFGDSSYYYYFYDWLFTPARVGWDVRLNDLTIDNAMTVRACETATLGPGLDLAFPADLDVQAGSLVNLESPFEAGANVLLEMGIDPALLPD